ncbi:molybdopterin converting factor subunit 1 [Acidithiobacillus sp.]|jgi:molybdopterin synthase sulfur carrier subunit|uniref:molybdopterin converting factor subunit 1 n=1 Tax=Acidithiobacillus sp. TaxID=1872118 RepID=UPI0025BB2ABB|nr:molybdopterin converting factor subunit 1 [Acidithiobacillus sp.]MCK9188378.1 molybdopterin converting factor subunit 1 [Acidithiobacillus sp.]MCK9358799.1 molybdopterin converting factor subunit 1 [Acidithiobacillus sp.]
MIHVKFFASVRERAGVEEMSLPVPDGGVTVAEVLVLAEGAAGVVLHDAHLLAAVNLQHVPFSDVVRDGDEVAFFPPVTGG